MTIVFVSHDASCSGGAQGCLLELIKGLKKQKPEWNLFVIFPSKGELIAKCQPYIAGYTIIRQPFWIIPLDKQARKKTKLTLLNKCFRSAFRSFLYLKKIKPDYVVTNTIAIPAASFAAKWAKCKHIWFIHELPLEAKNATFAFEEDSIMRIVDKHSQSVLVTSDYALTYYKKFFCNSSKITRVYQSVEVKVFEKAVNRKDNRYTLALIGSFEFNKGQLKALEALDIVIKRGIDVHCYLVGATKTSYTEQVKTYIQEHQLGNNITLIDYTSNPLVYFKQADVALVCSRSEAFGRVTIEAQKCGIPVIASNTGANPELIKDGVNGFLYREKSPQDLADKIELLNNAELRMKLAATISSTIDKQFTQEQFATDFIHAISNQIPE